MVNEAEVDVFLEFPCFLYDPVNVGNLNLSFRLARPLWPIIFKINFYWSTVASQYYVSFLYSHVYTYIPLFFRLPYHLDHHKASTDNPL